MREFIYPAQMGNRSMGGFRADVISERTNTPIEGATVEVFGEGSVSGDTPIEELTTDIDGQTSEIELDAPNIEFSLEPSAVRPYSEYNVVIKAPGYEDVYINGAEILPGVTALQQVQMIPIVEENTAETFVIGDHTLYGDFPPKIMESEIKDVSETGEIVLSRVVIPETVVVHDGPPSDRSAKNYYVKYRDYIKNVASSEIYATWPESTITANVLAIMSFTLNRVFTEWYRNKGYDFTITSSTAFDQKWISGRNIYNNISNIVDSVFTNYLSRPGVLQPILTQYCDGNRVSCPNVMSQWGSKNLGDRGYSAIEILRYYYGENMFINSANTVSGIPASWPTYNLTIGSSGNPVRTIQKQLNRIARSYPSIPTVAVDGRFGSGTADAVKVFQRVFDLPQSGIVDYPTWYKISEIYVGVSKIAEYV
ncbi:MAG: peptidoglycan-binding protein [Lachnospiraceae bacterium]|nr:peptidoglycan-binding protein [Lachnospiraceae bacterium]